MQLNYFTNVLSTKRQIFESETQLEPTIFEEVLGVAKKLQHYRHNNEWNRHMSDIGHTCEGFVMCHDDKATVKTLVLQSFLST